MIKIRIIEQQFEPDLLPWNSDSTKKPFRCSVCNKANTCRANDYLFLGDAKCFYCDQTSCEKTINSIWNQWAGKIGLPKELMRFASGFAPSDEEKVCHRRGCLLYEKHKGEHRFSWREVEG